MTIDDIDQAIARFEALDAEATPGPWRLEVIHSALGYFASAAKPVVVEVSNIGMNDAELLISLRNDGLPLLRRLRDEVAAARRDKEDLQERLDSLQEEFERWKEHNSTPESRDLMNGGFIA